ncbi:MAG TPA: glycosyltransferase family 4 protein [Saprospiraceae bacterium]|nr:glycosyltransferase family 4 protein [Saprospiraceae bacterium]
MADPKKLVIGITISGSVPLIRGQALYFSQQGYQVFLLCPKDEKSLAYCREEGCTLLEVKIERRISPFKDLISLIQITRILRKLNPDIVNVGTPKMGLIGSVAAWLAKVPVRIYTCRGLRYEHEKGWFRKLLYFTETVPGKLSHKVICISPSVKERAVKDRVFNVGKTVAFAKGSSNGINAHRFSKENINFMVREKLLGDLNLKGRFIFGMIGRLIDRKGINELFEAFQILYSHNHNISLVLVGKKDLSQNKDKSLISNITGHPAIQWVGWQDDVPLYMSLFHVFVMPAWWEGFGNAYVEAAAMGIPVIGSSGTGCVDAVNHGYNGLVVPPKDVNALVNAMEAYLHQPNLMMEHGKNGVIWASHFKQEDIWRAQKELYESFT